MAINDRSSVSATVSVNIARPGGGLEVYLDPDDLPRYSDDPDAFAAAHFGLTKLQYIEWVQLEGAPLCGARTKGGDLCRSMTGGFQLGAADWLEKHRRLLCAAHHKALKCEEVPFQ